MKKFKKKLFLKIRTIQDNSNLVLAFRYFSDTIIIQPVQDMLMQLHLSLEAVVNPEQHLQLLQRSLGLANTCSH